MYFQLYLHSRMNLQVEVQGELSGVRVFFCELRCHTATYSGNLPPPPVINT